MTREGLLPTQLAISIVSHGQGHLIRPLLEDLQPVIRQGAEIVLTLNIPEDESFIEGLALGLTMIRNSTPKGFGDNHNAASAVSSRDWFAVVNPDIRCEVDVFAALAETHQRRGAGVVAPRVLAPDGRDEDSVRRYPSILRIAGRVLARFAGRRLQADYALDDGEVKSVDWAAGMFLLFTMDDFRRIGGFDTRYFMYLEDADICRRLAAVGLPTVLDPRVQVIHDAQRATGRSRQHLRWHVSSLMRFLFLAPWSRRPPSLTAASARASDHR